MTIRTNFALILIVLVGILSCKNPSSSKKDGRLKGTITQIANNTPVYIIINDSLVCTTDINNNFSVDLEYGDHEILLSAIGYLDENISVSINGNKNMDIQLTENSETGRIYGEFQDLDVFQQRISQNSDLENWTEKDICDGVTGATIMEDNYEFEFKQPQLFIGDSLIKYADVYGQYWIEVQSGTYPLTGKCEGFSSKTEIIKVMQDAREYVNFYIKQN